MAEVVIYVAGYCAYCDRAKALLRRKGVVFREVDLTGDAEKRAWLAQLTGRRTVPQIFIGGRSVGGYDDIAALDRRGELDPLLAA